ncbi:MAG: hemerythrin domain-containing protein [Phycisphaeraceae bacterium]
MQQDTTRRGFMQTTVAMGGGLWLAGCTSGQHGPGEGPQDAEHEQEVSPAEDLMREHGVLKRVLLVYGECVRRLDGEEDLPPQPLADAARIIREFIEDYHEKLEEDYLFPRFRRAHVHVELVDVLLAQHQAGRRLTERTLHLATPRALRRPDDRRALADALTQFIRMYSPHEAREDTVLFPALRKIVTSNEYDALGEEFEEKEHQLFGEEGFDRMVDRVASIEKALGLYELAQFTPKV